MIHKLVKHDSRAVRALTIAAIVIAIWDVVWGGGGDCSCDALRQQHALQQNTVAVTLR